MSTCDRCKKTIGGTPVDPIHVTSLGTHHEVCMRLAWHEHETGKATRKAASRARRSAAMKARWADGVMRRDTP